MGYCVGLGRASASGCVGAVLVIRNGVLYASELETGMVRWRRGQRSRVEYCHWQLEQNVLTTVSVLR